MVWMGIYILSMTKVPLSKALSHKLLWECIHIAADPSLWNNCMSLCVHIYSKLCSACKKSQDLNFLQGIDKVSRLLLSKSQSAKLVDDPHSLMLKSGLGIKFFMNNSVLTFWYLCDFELNNDFLYFTNHWSVFIYICQKIDASELHDIAEHKD